MSFRLCSRAPRTTSRSATARSSLRQFNPGSTQRLAMLAGGIDISARLRKPGFMAEPALCPHASGAPAGPAVPSRLRHGGPGDQRWAGGAQSGDRGGAGRPRQRGAARRRGPVDERGAPPPGRLRRGARRGRGRAAQGRRDLLSLRAGRGRPAGRGRRRVARHVGDTQGSVAGGGQQRGVRAAAAEALAAWPASSSCPILPGARRAGGPAAEQPRTSTSARCARCGRAAAVAAAAEAEQAAEVLTVLGSLRYGRWWPSLDDIQNVP